jgi:hypothetical protein
MNMAVLVSGKKKVFFLLVALIAFFGVQGFFLQQHTQKTKFSDEMEHFAGAWAMAREGKVLYQDISVNHQPLPFVTGYALLKVADPPNLFMLAERSRQMMLFLSFLGALLLTWRFRLPGLVASVVIEMIKYFTFGYFLLGESLAVYPLMMTGGLLYLLIWKRERLTFVDDLLMGASLFAAVFSLLPNLAFAGLSFLIYARYRTKAAFGRVAPTFLLLMLLLAPLVSWQGWFEETIHNVWLYFLPTDTHVHSLLDGIPLAVFPFLSFLRLSDTVARYYAILWGFGIIFWLFTYRKNLKKLWTFAVFYVLMITLNVRITTFENMGWGVFHLLPQMALMTMILTMVMRVKPRYLMLLPVIIGVLSLNWWFETRDKGEDHYVQYSRQESVGLALAAIKEPGDTLLSGPQEAEVNLAANLPFPARQVTYFNWSYAVPRLQQEFFEMLKINLPTFIYFPEDNSPFYNGFYPYVGTHYVAIEHIEDGLIGLYMLKEAVADRPDDAWEHFEYHRLKKPLIN